MKSVLLIDASRPRTRSKARVYLRISRPDEAAILENQRRTAIEHCEAAGLEIVRVYEEIASGGDGARSIFSELMRDLRANEIAVFTALSRMTRGGIGAALDTLRVLEARGVGWHFVEQPILNWDERTLPLIRDVLLAVLSAVDEDYRRRISIATKGALARRKALGLPIGRPPGARDLKPRKKRSPPLRRSQS